MNVMKEAKITADSTGLLIEKGVAEDVIVTPEILINTNAPIITSTFVPNLDEQHISQHTLITDYVVNLAERGPMETELKWCRGHFLDLFPDLFICNNDNGGDIT